jgi:uncharacterized membrane protein
MSPRFVLLLAFGIGAVGGLRSMTAPAAVAWAARLDWIHLSGSPLAFMGSRWAVAIFTLAALGEFVADLLPNTPSRISAFPLTARIVVGFLTGACMSAAGGVSLWVGGVVGAAGAIAGAGIGYQARTSLVRTLRVADALIAIPEDAAAIALALLIVSRFISF